MSPELINALISGGVAGVMSSLGTLAVMKAEIRFLKRSLAELRKRVDEIDRHLRPFRFRRSTSES
jgi:hypothetical protein